MTLQVIGTREGVSEALRRLDITVRTREAIVHAHPPLAAALSADRHALMHRLEEELRVKMHFPPAISAPNASSGDASGGEKNSGRWSGAAGKGGSGGGCGVGGGADSGGGGAGGGRGGGNGGGGGKRGVSGSGRGGRGRSGDAMATPVRVSGLPQDVEVARLYLAQLDCLELAIPIERKAFTTIFGPGGANLRQMEVGTAARCCFTGGCPSVTLLLLRRRFHPDFEYLVTKNVGVVQRAIR